MECCFKSWSFYLCVNLVALYAPAPVVIPTWAESAWVYPFYPVMGPSVLVAVNTWSSVGEIESLVYLVALLGCVMLISYGWHRGTAQLTSRSCCAARLGLPAVLFVISWLQGAFAILLIQGLNGVAHS